MDFLTHEIPLIVLHADYGDPECCGILMSVDRGCWTDLTCNECGAVIAIVETAEVQPMLLRMAIFVGASCTFVCTNCSEVNTFTAFYSIEAYTCRHCRLGILTRRVVQ